MQSPSPTRMLYALRAPGRFALHSMPQKEQERVGGEDDNGQTLEELARRMEALERENQELREALGSDTSGRQSEAPLQRPRSTQGNEMTVASSKTVRALLLGPRDELAYSRPL